MGVRIGIAVGLFFVVLGLFWATRRSLHQAAAEFDARLQSDERRVDPRDTREQVARDSVAETSTPELPPLAPGSMTSPDDANDRRLRGRVIDTKGARVAGVSVELFQSEADGINALDVELARSRIEVASTKCDPRGEFAFDVEAGVLYRLQARNPSAVSSVAASCRAGSFVELVLEPTASLRGRVTLANDGRPISRAQLQLRSADARTSHGDATRDDGEFRMVGLESGEWLLSIDPGDAAMRLEEHVTLRAGEQLERDFVLERGPDLAGKVTDATTGLPIVGAEVSQSWTFERSVRTDGQGEYALRNLARRYDSISVRAEGYGRLERAVEADHLTPGTHIDVALTPARSARGRIVDEHGQVLAGAYVAAGASDFGGDQGKQRVDWISGKSGNDGRFELRDLRPDVRHALLLRKRGLGTATFDFPNDEFERREIDFGDVVMPSASSVEGRALDDADAPLVGELVQLSGAQANRTHFGELDKDERWLIDSYVAQREVRTDQLGRFEFADVAPGAYVLRLQRSDSHERVEKIVRVDSGAPTRDVRLIVAKGLAISGRVSTEDDGTLPTTYISVDPEGEGRSGDAQVGPDGRFRVSGLSETKYRLTVYPYESEADRLAGRVFLTTVLEHVDAGANDVVITLRHGELIRGQVLDLDGAPVDSAQVLALDATGGVVDRSQSSADGSFTLEVPPGERFELVSSTTPTYGESIEAFPDSARVPGVLAGSANVTIRVQRTP